MTGPPAVSDSAPLEVELECSIQLRSDAGEHHLDGSCDLAVDDLDLERQRHPAFEADLGVADADAPVLSLGDPTMREGVVPGRRGVAGEGRSRTHGVRPRSGANGHGLHGRRRRTDEPRRKIEEVDAVFDEHPAGPGLVPEPVVTREALIGGVVLEGEARHVPEQTTLGFAGAQQSVDRDDEWGESQEMVDGDDPAVRLGGGGNSPATGNVDGERLLDEDVAAGIERLDREVGVRPRRCRNDDEVQQVAAECRPGVFVDGDLGGHPTGERCGGFLVVVADGHQPGPRRPFQGGGDERTKLPAADESDTLGREVAALRHGDWRVSSATPMRASAIP